MLLEVARRAWGRRSAMRDRERRQLVARFWKWLDETGPRLHFECSMLQTAVEGEDGVVRWRDVRCEDEDDFQALWSDDWAAVESLKGDAELWLPVERGAMQSPLDMLQSLAAGKQDGHRVLAGLGVEGSRVQAAWEDGARGSVLVRGGEIVGQRARYGTRV